MLKKGLFLAVWGVLLLLSLVQGRLFSNTVGIPHFRRDGCWTFLDRLHLDPGFMSINAQVKLLLSNPKQAASYKLELVAIPDSVWAKSLEVKCNLHNLTNEESQLKREKELVFEFQLDANIQYSARVVTQLEVPTEESYSFVIRDCSRSLVNDGYGRESKIEVNLDARNNEKNTSSGEESYGWLLPLLIAAGGGMLWFLHKDKQEQGDNWIKLTVKVSLWVGVTAIVFKYLGYLVYAYGRGVEYGVFDVFYLLLHATSDSILLVLILLLSYGWTVTFKNARDFDLYVPLACMLGLVNIIMTMLNKISDGEHDKYHMYDSIPAYIMIGFRCVGLVVFLVGIAQCWLQINKSSNKAKLTNYFYQLTTIGFIYMTFVPIGFVAIRYVGNRYKKEVMFFAMELTRFGLNIWLAWLAGSKKSAYRAILGQSFMEKAEKFY